MGCLSNDWFVGLNEPRDTDSDWWTQSQLPRPHSAGLFKQCGGSGCWFIELGEPSVQYNPHYRYARTRVCVWGEILSHIRCLWHALCVGSRQAS